MNKSFSSLWFALGMLVLVFFLFAGVTATQADEVDDAVAKAVAYLKGQAADDATKTMALVAFGETVDVSYLQSFSGSAAIEYAKPIMALAASGKDPATFPNENFIAKLKGFASGTQLGSATQLNDDIWGILALVSSGVPTSDSVIQNSKVFILANQNTDGGWAWNVGGTSDTNDTAVAIMALLETGMVKSDTAIQNAISYLKSAQNDDGGFPYDPKSSFGTGSDANSDAWVITIINKLGENATSWTKNNHNPVEHLLSLQDTDGGFWWMKPPADFNNKGATADAVIALTGKSFPVARFIPSTGSVQTEVFFRIVGSQGGICKGAVQSTTALNVVVNAAEQCNYTYLIQQTSFGPYLSEINTDRAEGTKGWLYRVNGVMPTVGAADYTLSGGEQVLWYYGEFDDEPPSLGDVSSSVSLSVEIVQQTPGGQGSPEVGFSVNPSSLAFGQLESGKEVTKEVTLKNEGQKNLSVTTEVQGDAVFNFLKIENALWNAFETLLSTGSQKNVEVELSLPSDFSSLGSKQGTLIFWGKAQN